MSAPAAAASADEAVFKRPLKGLIADLRDGALSAVALLEHYLARISRLNPALNAFVALDPDATAAAADSEARLKAGRARSLLEGIPVAVKDNLIMRGCPAAWGSPLYADYVPDHDEWPVARLRAAGAVLLGKTNTPEFAMRGYTANSVYGVTRNPWNPALTPGGSSGGAVAAVAAGLVPLALATDGGGSIRRPAAYTGLVGLKPTAGRILRGRGFPQLMFDCEVVGAIARSVADTRILFEALAQSSRLSSPATKRARILFVERFGQSPVDPRITASCRQTASHLSALGHDVVQGDLPFDITPAMEAWRALGEIGLARLAEAEPRFFTCASPDFITQAETGSSYLATDCARLIETLLEFRAETARAFEHFDFLMTPATAAQPWPAAEPYPLLIDEQAAGPRGHAIFTGWVNACGHPAIAIPAQPAEDGMPIGIQLVGPPNSDEFLLDIAEAYEAAHPWSHLWPALAVQD